ncbi:MAG: PEGA domain-containing protein [Candidatus Saccharimonadales bacterium]
MDFLDPRKKRTHRIRLMIGYALMATVIGLGTIVLGYAADGFGINTKTGEIVQNGLLFVGSEPGGAKIYLNGIDQDRTTSARLILQTGDYTLSLQKDGYRQWEKTFHLNERSVARYVYPFLFPIEPVTTAVKHYPTLPLLIAQSPDRRWLFVQQPSVANRANLHLYDTRALDRAAVTVTLPAGLLSSLDSAGSALKEVSWTSNSDFMLLEHKYKGGKEFIVVNRSQPGRSFNVNKLFKVAADKVTFRDAKIDQLYIFDKDKLSLQVGDTRNNQLSQPILTGVVAFNNYDQNLVSYITATGAGEGQVNVRIWDGDQSYTLSSLPLSNTYLLDAASYQDNWYYIAGSSAAQQLNIYKNPLNSLKGRPGAKASPMLALRNPGATQAEFSINSRVIGVQGGQTFSSYDLETQGSYQFKVKFRLSGLLKWMDGHRWVGQAGKSIYVIDYDGTNPQELGPSLLPSGGFFSSDYNHLLTFQERVGGKGVTLVDIDMRAGKDLPKKP